MKGVLSYQVVWGHGKLISSPFLDIDLPSPSSLLVSPILQLRPHSIKYAMKSRTPSNLTIAPLCNSQLILCRMEKRGKCPNELMFSSFSDGSTVPGLIHGSGQGRQSYRH